MLLNPAGELLLLTHSTLTDTLASYDYSLDSVGNRRVLTESLVTVDNVPAGAYLESDGLVVMEAENGDRTNGTTHNWLLKTSLPGYTGTSYLDTSLDNDTLYQTNEITASPVVDYVINFTSPGTYTVWLREYAPNGTGDSLYVGLEGDNGLASSPLTGFRPRAWAWANHNLQTTQPLTLVVSKPGIYTLHLWQREDGLRVDRILLTTNNNHQPMGDGPPESDIR